MVPATGTAAAASPKAPRRRRRCGDVHKPQHQGRFDRRQDASCRDVQTRARDKTGAPERSRITSHAHLTAVRKERKTRPNPEQKPLNLQLPQPSTLNTQPSALSPQPSPDSRAHTSIMLSLERFPGPTLNNHVSHGPTLNKHVSHQEHHKCGSEASQMRTRNAAHRSMH